MIDQYKITETTADSTETDITTTTDIRTEEDLLQDMAQGKPELVSSARYKATSLSTVHRIV